MINIVPYFFAVAGAMVMSIGLGSFFSMAPQNYIAMFAFLMGLFIFSRSFKLN